MGVPGLFSYLRKKYPNIFSQGNKEKFNHIFIDGNALLYPISSKYVDPIDIATNLLEVAQGFSQQYSSEVHIYMDGSAHMAKIKQQRMRRFLYDPPTIRNGTIWSNAVFTPGTLIMKSIHDQLVFLLSKYPGVSTYSSYLESGEGEHKIMKVIKELSGQRIAIVGKDADLLFLGMSVTKQEGGLNDIFILRHNDDEIDGYSHNDPLFEINCLKLRNSLVGDMNIGSIWDLIIASFMLGNDFVPSVPELGNIRKAMEILSIVPFKLYDTFNQNILWEGILSLIDKLSNIIRKNLSYRSFIYEDWIGEQKSPSMEYFDSIYYPICSVFEVDVENVSYEWVRSIQWIFNYYKNGLYGASISWQYPYDFAPTLETLNTYFTPISDEDRQKLLIVEEPLKPEQALIAVLPSWLHYLVKEDIKKKAMKVFPQCYPSYFELMPHTREPIIPLVSYYDLKQIN